MLTQQKKQREQGFTIIEVMIVLAIAGLIMLIVFLAVPALQRNARNTQRVQDVGQIGTAAQNVVDNNNGDITQLSGKNGTSNLQAELPKLAYYIDPKKITVGTGKLPQQGVDTESVQVYTGADCVANTITNGNGQMAAKATSARSIAVVYMTEPNVYDCKAL